MPPRPPRGTRRPPQTGPATDQDKGVIATFTNSVLDKAVVFWENEDGEKVPVTGEIRKGTSERLSTHPGHKFLAYQGDKLLKSFTVTAQRGGWQEFEL